MLKHVNAAPAALSRTVVLGAGGFVGGAAARRLDQDGVPVLGLARTDLDLLDGGAGAALAARLRPDDALVVVSARAPVRDVPMLLDNLRMIESVRQAIAEQPVAHVVYVSSDAVYADSPEPLSEASCAEPGSLHGIMHLARELVLRLALEGSQTPFAVLRPTLIYGADDPHNGYGPNRFRRLAEAGQDIVLFGEGEERRDHVWVEDVAEIVRRVVLHRSAGVLNVATGHVASFRDIAELVVGQFERPVGISGSPRQGPMPHGGYRPFDVAGCRAAFPGFSYIELEKGLLECRRAAP